MSALSPMMINNLLGSQMNHGSSSSSLTPAVTEKSFADLIRKHYSDHYETYGHSAHA